MELAKLLKDKKLKYRIDLVAYTLEEPIYFNTEYMGSYVHAKYLFDNHIKVKGMISLEMIGYFKDAAVPTKRKLSAKIFQIVKNIK